MNLIDRAGRFRALVTDWSVGETKQQKLPRFVIEFHATEYFNAGQWVDWTEYDQGIRGYFTLFGGNGEPVELNIQAMQDVLGWDGQSLESFQAMDLAGKQCQIVVREKEYEGKKSLEVAFLNAWDAEATIKKMDASELKSMGANWNSKLRALSKPPATKPIARPQSPAPAPSSNGGTATMTRPATKTSARGDVASARARAWEKFQADYQTALGHQNQIERQWHEIVERLVPGKEQDKMTVTEWLLVTERAGDEIVPF